MDCVRIFDTTLRDGEQAPGFSMDVRAKCLIAAKLEQLNVDIIEAGFPTVSEQEQESVKKIAERVEHCAVAALARVRQRDLETGLRALASAKRPRLHIFLATSDLHLTQKLHISRQEALEQLSRAIAFSREHCDEVEFSSEDASRSDPSFLREVAICAAQSGANVLTFADTVGHAMPQEYANIFATVSDALGEYRDVVLSAHCHDDLGMAVANSLAAVSAGARQVHVTVNGIGERAGNAALEEVVTSLNVRKDYFQLRTNVNATELFSASQLLAITTGIGIPPNKAIVGSNAFAHEAGIHQDGLLKDRLTYQIISPSDVGAPGESFILGKHSGRHAIRHLMMKCGCVPSSQELEWCYQLVQERAEARLPTQEKDLVDLLTKQRLRSVCQLGVASEN